MRLSVITLVVVLGVPAGAIALQIFLSKRQNKWLGLMLPIISLLCSVIILLGMVGYTVTGPVQTTVETVNMETGEVVEEVRTVEEGNGDFLSILAPAMFTFLLTNIPTVVFVGIYFACREKLRRNKEMERMSIQDLE